MNQFSANLLHQWRWQIPVWRYFDFTCQSIKLTGGCRSTAHDALAFLLLLLMFKLSVRSICLFDNNSHYVCSCSENGGSLYPSIIELVECYWSTVWKGGGGLVDAALGEGLGHAGVGVTEVRHEEVAVFAAPRPAWRLWGMRHHTRFLLGAHLKIKK